MPAIPESVARFRETYRDQAPRYYSGVGHCAFMVSALAGTALWHLARLRGVTALEWLVIPGALALGNWIEYLLHRYPLHRPVPGLRAVFRIHSQQHHRYFTHDAIEFDSPDELLLVLFPPWAPVLAAAGGTLAGWALVGLGASPNVGSLFAAMTCGYMLLYETLHLCHHLGDDDPPIRVPLLRFLRDHHRAHHDLRLMSEANFNVTFPLFDWVYGTWTREPAS